MEAVLLLVIFVAIGGLGIYLASVGKAMGKVHEELEAIIREEQAKEEYDGQPRV